MKSVGTTIKTAFAVLLFAGLASANAQLDFSLPAFGAGSISYNPGSGSITGTGIQVTSIKGTDGTLHNDQSIGCNSCVINFTSGSLVSVASGLYTFASGGTFTLVGSVLGGPVTSLLSGVFSSATLQTAGGYAFETALFTTAVSKAITDYYGMPATPPNYAGGVAIMFGASYGAGGSITSSTLFGGTVGATAVAPEPATIVLLGTVLLGLVALERRRQKA